MEPEKVRVYTLQYCPGCDSLKNYLRSKNIEFEEVSLATAEAITELRVNQVFSREAPILQAGKRFMENPQMFATFGTINARAVDEFLIGQ